MTLFVAISDAIDRRIVFATDVVALRPADSDCITTEKKQQKK